MCAVGKNREPVFVKTVIDGRTMLEEFSSLLTESEASMQLSEKRAWWGTRRRLDRRIKACTCIPTLCMIMTSVTAVGSCELYPVRMAGRLCRCPSPPSPLLGDHHLPSAVCGP